MAEFEAGWALTMTNLRRGIREPLRPEEVREHARTAQRDPGTDPRMITGTPSDVVRRLRELQAAAEVDEIVLVTPSIDRARRRRSLELIGDAWADAALPAAAPATAG